MRLAKARLDGEDLEPFIVVDAEVRLSQLDWRVMEFIPGMAPLARATAAHLPHRRHTGTGVPEDGNDRALEAT